MVGLTTGLLTLGCTKALLIISCIRLVEPMAKSTNSVIADRVRTLKQMILTGASNSTCVDFAVDQWHVSTRAA